MTGFGDQDNQSGPLSQEAIDALLQALHSETDTAAKTGEQEPEREAPSLVETTPPPRAVDPAWQRFADLTVEVTVSIGETTVTGQEWLQIGRGTRVALKRSLSHQQVTLKLNGVAVGVGRVVLLAGGVFGVKIVKWGPRTVDSRP